MKRLWLLLITGALCATAYFSLTIFVVPPIGALPEGRTVIMWRLENTKFIDSPDAMCDRMHGGVSLLCRGMTMVAVVQNTKILLRLPYIDWLYLASTGGKRFEFDRNRFR
ncbi:hypothetical protein SB18R_03360 [Pseudomonas oryzihabitans]|nr:hypothetical protein SB9_12595 [Pseudomonas psychrotolerans]KTT78279.1 hypothetical protein SB18R_03360 [Pseudomonas psychrotolerans]